MKEILSILCVLIAMTSCDAQKQSKKEIQKSYHKNGKVFTESEMEDGKKHGEERVYWENGNIMYRQYFKNDMLVDSFYQYSKEKANNIEMIGYVVPISRFVALDYPSLKILGISDYKEKQVGEGLVKTFYSNGKITSLTEYKNGKSDGIDVLYFSNGNIKVVRHRKQGQIVPPIMEFDSTGKMVNYVPVKE